MPSAPSAGLRNAAAGCASTDNSVKCAVLLEAYSAWGNAPSPWAASMAVSSRLCGWAGEFCTASRVTELCAFPTFRFIRDANSLFRPMLGTCIIRAISI